MMLIISFIISFFLHERERSGIVFLFLLYLTSKIGIGDLYQFCSQWAIISFKLRIPVAVINSILFFLPKFSYKVLTKNEFLAKNVCSV